MKNSILMASMDYLDDRYIAEADPAAAAPLMGIRRRLAAKWTAMAAGTCAAVLLVWSVIIPVVRYLSLPDVPVFDNAQYTADEIGSLFGIYDSEGVGTSSYTKLYVPSAEYLYITSVPDTEYIEIYRHETPTESLDREAFTAFTHNILSRFAAAAGEAAPSYEVKQDENWYDGAYLRADVDSASAYGYYIRQYDEYQYVAIYANSPLGKISLNGVPVAVDQTMTDEEIIASLGAVRDQLFSLFDVTFENARVYRHYNESGEHGVAYLEVYFYNEGETPLDAYSNRPSSDYIRLYFDNVENYSGDVVSDTVLSNVSITYRQFRIASEDRYTVSKRVKMISLEEAEALLYNGYVFGGHSCPLCMAAQSKVDFEGYEYVGLTYIFGDDSATEPAEGIPFYTFYKRIGTSENGNEIYAMTYVPAIEVEGYEAYFEREKENHGRRSFDEAD